MSGAPEQPGGSPVGARWEPGGSKIRRMRKAADRPGWLDNSGVRVCSLVALFLVSLIVPCLVVAQDQDDEIVATLAAGRVIVHATRENVIFIAINEPIEEAGSAPPRVVSLDGHHIGVLFGSSEWRIPAEPTPIRLDKDLARTAGPDPNWQGSYNGDAEPDLETIGVAFLEKLTPLAARLHHKLDFPPDQPLFELVVIGFGPRDYGPEVWTVEYRMTQQEVSSRGDFWQTRVLRPRFEQIYPPGKHEPRKMVETCYPLACKGPTLQQFIEANEPSLAKLSSSDPKWAKVADLIAKGQAQKASPTDAAPFLRAAIPLIYSGRSFVMGQFEDQRGFDWIVPPQEPVEKAQKEPVDKSRPPDAPTLRRRADPPPR